MHAHRIDVFNRAYDDDVVILVSNNLKFVFFPAEQRLFDKNLPHWRQVDTVPGDFFEFIKVVSDAATASAECKRRSNDNRESRILPRNGLRGRRWLQ